jgi:hypothetical protein
MVECFMAGAMAPKESATRLTRDSLDVILLCHRRRVITTDNGTDEGFLTALELQYLRIQNSNHHHDLYSKHCFIDNHCGPFGGNSTRGVRTALIVHCQSRFLDTGL